MCDTGFHGLNCEFGCGTETIKVAYGGSLTDGSSYFSVFPNTTCTWTLEVEFAGSTGVAVEWVDFQIDPNSLDHASLHDGPTAESPVIPGTEWMTGRTNPVTRHSTGNTVTVRLQTDDFFPSDGLELRFFSLGCPPGSFINRFAGGNDTFAPQCELCPLGTSNSVFDAFECLSCREGSFSEYVAGGDVCKVAQVSYKKYRCVSSQRCWGRSVRAVSGRYTSEHGRAGRLCSMCSRRGCGLHWPGRVCDV